MRIFSHFLVIKAWWPSGSHLPHSPVMNCSYHCFNTLWPGGINRKTELFPSNIEIIVISTSHSWLFYSLKSWWRMLRGWTIKCPCASGVRIQWGRVRKFLLSHNAFWRNVHWVTVTTEIYWKPAGPTHLQASQPDLHGPDWRSEHLITWCQFVFI